MYPEKFQSLMYMWQIKTEMKRYMKHIFKSLSLTFILKAVFKAILSQENNSWCWNRTPSSLWLNKSCVSKPRTDSQTNDDQCHRRYCQWLSGIASCNLILDIDTMPLKITVVLMILSRPDSHKWAFCTRRKSVLSAYVPLLSARGSIHLLQCTAEHVAEEQL